jgi:hypothetical protein
MATFQTDKAARTPFGKNQFLRSTQDVKYESYTVAHATFPENYEVDGEGTKILQPGTVMAKITSGPQSGKVGPFQASVTDGRQTAANIVGLAGTFLPWQLLERDVEIAVAYECAAVQAWCIEHNAAGEAIVLSNGTRTAIEGLAATSILFK